MSSEDILNGLDLKQFQIKTKTSFDGTSSALLPDVISHDMHDATEDPIHPGFGGF